MIDLEKTKHVEADVNKSLRETAWLRIYRLTELYFTKEWINDDEEIVAELHLTLRHMVTGGALKYTLKHADIPAVNSIFAFLQGEDDFEGHFNRLTRFVPTENKEFIVVEDLNSRNPIFGDRHFLFFAYDGTGYYAAPNFFAKLPNDLPHWFNFFDLAYRYLFYDKNDNFITEFAGNLTDFAELVHATAVTLHSADDISTVFINAVEDVTKLALANLALAEDGVGDDAHHALSRFSNLLDRFIWGEYRDLADFFFMDLTAFNAYFAPKAKDLKSLAWATKREFNAENITAFQQALSARFSKK